MYYVSKKRMAFEKCQIEGYELWSKEKESGNFLSGLLPFVSEIPF